MTVEFMLSTPATDKGGFQHLSMKSSHLPRVGDHVFVPTRYEIREHIYQVVAVLHEEDEPTTLYVVQASLDAAIRARRLEIEANEDALIQWGREHGLIE